MAAVKSPIGDLETIAWSAAKGQRLRELREQERKLSRNKLVAKIRDSGHDISPQYVQKLETGFRTSSGKTQTVQSVGAQTLQAILGALDIRLDKFLSSAN
ncbi:helix-turn-helix domain-containing protein [Rubidibacter lacunae]|uniref:helix-turn-helix domain-containing protein n=1 Tax=Rubidibacter lacunae TaxID=582514 RepID=UPI0003FFA4F4|nr:helix-turn-helix transcriptional regulator [Rubidibacter lacunae]